MIVSYFLLLVVIRSDRMTGFVGCSITTVETDNYIIEDGRRWCVNCSDCEYTNDEAKYTIEFCLPNENCTVLDCCTCKYHCEKNSWTKHKKCRSQIIETDERASRRNHDDSNTLSSYNFLLMILLVFAISLIVYYWRKLRNDCRDVAEKTHVGPNEFPTDSSSRSLVASTSTGVVNREELSYDVIPVNFDLDDLDYDDRHASLFKTTSWFDDAQPSPVDDERSAKTNDSSPRCSLTSHSTDAETGTLYALSFAKSPVDDNQSPPFPCREQTAARALRSTPEIRNVPANDFSFAHGCHTD